MDAVRREAWIIWREPVYIFGGNHDGIKFAARVMSTIIKKHKISGMSHVFFLPKSVSRIRDILKRIRILGSVHWITGPDPASDPAPAPDPALFLAGFDMPSKITFSLISFYRCIYNHL
jgi:hypothetical protein